MYDHTVREFQYLSTRDNLEPQLQIDPFPGREADYHPYGYHGHMPPGYAYRPALIPMMALLDYLCLIMLYLMRRSLEVLRKFHWMILGGRFN
ncbi:hypothetical protein Tco_0741086 [Tanacetum coccineum]